MRPTSDRTNGVTYRHLKKYVLCGRWQLYTQNKKKKQILFIFMGYPDETTRQILHTVTDPSLP
jgi:hypothetical protein